MRWERLFGDLEAQLLAADEIDVEADVADRTRIEVARLRLIDRLRPAIGSRLRVQAGSRWLEGALETVGADWLLLTEGHGGQVLVVTAAISQVRGLGAASTAPGSEGAVAARLGLRGALRGLARDRTPVQLSMTSGEVVEGTIDRVGSDFVEVASHPVDELRRPGAVRSLVTVPVWALSFVRSN
jgi:hypothetical protein